MKTEPSLFGFLVTPQNYCAGVSEAAQSNDCCHTALVVIRAKKGIPLLWVWGLGWRTFPFPPASGRGKRRVWFAFWVCPEFHRVAGGYSGVCLSSGSEV